MAEPSAWEARTPHADELDAEVDVRGLPATAVGGKVLDEACDLGEVLPRDEAAQAVAGGIVDVAGGRVGRGRGGARGSGEVCVGRGIGKGKEESSAGL